MKTLIFLLAVIMGIMAIGCESMREKRIAEMLQNPKMENEIYEAILKSDEHLSKFLNKMIMDQNCRKMMTENYPMMKMMCMSDKMDSLINNNPEIMQRISNSMIKKMGADSVSCDRTCTIMNEDVHIKQYFKKHGSNL